MDSSGSAVPEMPRCPANMPLPRTDKKLRLHTSAKDTTCGIERSTAAPFDALPAVVYIEIAAFSPASSLSGASRSTLSAIRELHYKINMITAWVPDLDGHMGLQASGALATGRLVARITIGVVGQGYVVSTMAWMTRYRTGGG